LVGITDLFGIIWVMRRMAPVHKTALKDQRATSS
jgi:hypothetical protein